MNTLNPNSHQPNFGDDSIDIKRYISLFISNWYWFAFSLFLLISIAYGVNRWSEKIYTVSSTLLIKDDKYDGPNAEISNIFPGSDAFKTQQNLKNEIGILKSFSLNYRVMQELPDFHIVYVGVGKRGIVESRIYKGSPFIVLFDSLELQPQGQLVGIKVLSSDKYSIELNGTSNFSRELRFGERFNEKGFDFTIKLRNKDNYVYDKDGSNKYLIYFISPLALANQFRGKLSIAPIDEEASLVTLTSTGYVAEQEADYLNKLMEIYIRQGLELKNQTAEKTIEFIDEQIESISKLLFKAESDLEEFRLDNKFLDISREGALVQEKLTGIEGERTKLLLQKNYYNYLRDYIDTKTESGDIVAPSVMGVTDQLLIDLVQELATVQKQRLDMAMNLNLSAEPLKAIESNLKVIKESLIENIKSGIINIDRSLADVEKRLTQVETEMNKLPSTERQMVNIQRRFDLNNSVYTFLLEKRAEAGIAKASNVSDNRVIDSAEDFNSTKIRPKAKQNYMLALILGFLIPVFGIFLIDYLNYRIIDKKDIEKGTNAPVLGFISHSNFKSEIPVVEKPGSTLAESFRSVRTNLKYFLKDIKNPVISVSSTISSEGKTFISANLAIILAMLGKKVLLVGLDLRKPRIHKIFGAENEIGMSTLLCGQNKLDDIVVKTEVDNLFYAPAGPVPPNPAELIESHFMEEFIKQAKEKFDYIVIDTPPVAIVTDALLVSSLTDFYLFVVRQRYTSKNTLALIEELYVNENIKSLGIVINDISLSGYYGYGLRYGYSMGYGYSYGYNYYGNYINSRYGYSDKGKGYYTDESL